MNSHPETPHSLARAPRATWVQLRSFEAVARLGGVGLAAKALHLAQPTVSTQLKELTAAVGVPLFEPHGRGLSLTQHGELLLQTVQELSAVWRRFEDQKAEMQGLRRGRLRIAAVTTTEYFLPDMLGPFARAHPGIEIELTVQNRDAVVARLERGDDELATMMLPPTHLPLNQWPFLENPLVVIAAAGHRLAQRKRLKLDHLVSEPLLVREAGSGTRLASDKYFADQGVQWLPRMALGSNEAIKHAVRAGLGLAVLSRHTLSEDPAQDGLAVLPVAGFPIRRMWHLVWRKDRALSLAGRTLLQDIRASLGVRAQPSTTSGHLKRGAYRPV